MRLQVTLMPIRVSKNDGLLPLFDRLRPLLAKFVPPLVATVDERARYDIQFDKDYTTKSERTGKVTTRRGLSFAAIIVQKHYVGLYFMPIYSHPDAFAGLSARLLKALKGKSCIYVTELDTELEREISGMLETGYKIYKDFSGYE